MKEFKFPVITLLFVALTSLIIPTGVYSQAGTGSVCGNVEASAQPIPTPGAQNLGKGPTFIPYGENNPANWWEFHPLGVYVVSLGDFLMPSSYNDLIGKNVRLWNPQLSGNTIYRIDSYEIVPSCAPAVPTATIPLPLPVPTLARASPTPVQLPTSTPFLQAGTYPDFKQNFGYWSGDAYDSTSEPVAYLGCAMTDIANLLYYYGAEDVDPGILNGWLNAYDGYVEGMVNWSSVNTYPSKTAPIMLDRGPLSSGNPQDLKTRIYQYLGNGWPVILQLKGQEYGSDGHWVVAVGVSQAASGDQEYVIMDPLARILGDPVFGSIPPALQQLDVNANSPVISIVGARFYQPADGKPRPSLLATTIPTPMPYQPPSKPGASLVIAGHSPISYVLMDQQGRRLGYDPLNDSHYWEIPDGDYAYVLPIWNPADPSNSTGIGGGLEAYIPNAGMGDYRLMVYGIGDGPYEIDTFYTDELDQTNQTVVKGTAQTGDIQNYDIQVGQGSVRMAINPQGSTSSSSGGSLGLVLILVILAVGGVSIPVFRSLARKRVSSSHPSKQPVLVDPSGYRISVALASFTIGRSSSCSLRLADLSVSRQHARLRFASGRWYIQDMNSSGGTYINGARVDAAPLNNGDHIRIGSTEFEFRE